MKQISITLAVNTLTSAGIIAYPTEGVYGLGCDPNSAVAIERLLRLKQRPVEKGLILVAASWQQLEPWVDQSNQSIINKALATWPGPTTWLLPKSKQVSPLLTGAFDTLAVRVSAHPVIQRLCETFGGPIVSTSANLVGEVGCLDAKSVIHGLGRRIDYLLLGGLTTPGRPSKIVNALTDDVVRG